MHVQGPLNDLELSIADCTVRVDNENEWGTPTPVAGVAVVAVVDLGTHTVRHLARTADQRSHCEELSGPKHLTESWSLTSGTSHVVVLSRMPFVGEFCQVISTRPFQ